MKPSALLCFILCLFVTALRAADQPNVPFIICDDLNCDIGTYDHPLVQTPNIDKLAARGVQFDNAHCQYALCGPSRASFLSGLYPDQTLIHRNSIYLRQTLPDVVSLPMHFRDAGYFATRIGKLYHYGVPRHIGTGGHDDPYSWDHTINPIGRDKFDEDKIFTLTKGKFGGTLSWLAAEGTDDEQTDGIIANEAIERLEWHKERGDAFFLAVGLFRPHTPYVAPQKYFDLYPLDKIVVPEIPDGYFESLPEPVQRTVKLKNEETELTPELAKEVLQAYYASISFADAQVGRILDALDSTGLAENTIVLFTSDHGYHMGEHGQYQKTTLFENATRVPLIISSPQQKLKGHRTNAPAEMTDFYPTLSELAGLPVLDHCAGVSLVPALDDPEARPRKDALSQLTTRANGYSLRTERYRISQWKVSGDQFVYELYDHESDPGEMNNLSGKAEVVTIEEKLRARLQKRIKAANKKPEGLKQISDVTILRTPDFDYERKKK